METEVNGVPAGVSAMRKVFVTPSGQTE